MVLYLELAGTAVRADSRGDDDEWERPWEVRVAGASGETTARATLGSRSARPTAVTGFLGFG